jgi:4-hydroxybenzoate polyprenyltransferase/phosphoserine phosphatase
MQARPKAGGKGGDIRSPLQDVNRFPLQRPGAAALDKRRRQAAHAGMTDARRFPRQETEIVDSGLNTLPLCIDLDGTLLKTDTLMESYLRLVFARPWMALAPLAWLGGGKAKMKREMTRRIRLDPAALPYNEELLAHIRAEKARGRQIVLVTAADHAVADAVAAHLGLFDEVIASDGVVNLRGRHKAEALATRFGEGGFIYAGNDETDYAVWDKAAGAILVNAARRIETKARRRGARIDQVFDSPPGRLKAWIKALRPHQWAKNVLVFVPVVTANALLDIAAWTQTLLAFIAFCAIASTVYVVNDLSDLESDRRHARKRKRPFASGALPVEQGLLALPILVAIGVALALVSGAAWVLLAYAVITTAYTFKLKELPLVDVFTLAALYTVRVVAGGEASGYTVSHWLLGFSSFLFLSLALIKRVAELGELQLAGRSVNARRGYVLEDLGLLQLMGVASTFASSLVLALYISSDVVQANYAYPYALWLLVPLLLFWQCRLWMSTLRGYMHHDPLVYSAKDWVSWVVGAVALFSLIAANLPAFFR